MEEFAEYILNEEDLIAKEEIIYFLGVFMGNIIIFIIFVKHFGTI